MTRSQWIFIIFARDWDNTSQHTAVNLSCIRTISIDPLSVSCLFFLSASLFCNILKLETIKKDRTIYTFNGFVEISDCNFIKRTNSNAHQFKLLRARFGRFFLICEKKKTCNKNVYLICLCRCTLEMNVLKNYIN